MRLTKEEYMALIKIEDKLKQTKYNNKKTWVDGVCFDSKKEAEYYENHKLLMRAGEIAGFCRQPQFVMVEGNTENRAITYKADFVVFNNDGTYKIIDVKGFESQQWKRTFKQLSSQGLS